MARPKKAKTAKEMELARNLLRTEGKTKEEVDAELDATVVGLGKPPWPPQPTDGEDDEA